MGSGLSTILPCFKPAAAHRTASQPDQESDLVFPSADHLDETLGHSFCYVRSSNRFLSPTPSDRFVSPSQSLRFSPSHEPPRPRTGPETAFKSISGAAVSANSSTPRTVLQLENIYDDATDGLSTLGYGGRSNVVSGNAFESTSSFSALPLQPVPRGGGAHDPAERGGFFMSGPIERGALSGPLDPNPSGPEGRVHFSAPLGGMYVKKKRKKRIPGILRNFSEKKRPWVVPVLNFVSRKENSEESEAAAAALSAEGRTESDVQWALGKAGEDRVHVVISEEQAWLFVGIYDGFNGPDAPEFLMGNLYRAVFHELQGLFWEIGNEEDEAKTENEAEDESKPSNLTTTNIVTTITDSENGGEKSLPEDKHDGGEGLCRDSNATGAVEGRVKRVTFQSEGTEIRRKRLWEYLAEEDPEDGLDLSGSERFAFSVDDAISISNAGSAVNKRWLLLSKLKQGLTKHKEGHARNLLFPCRTAMEEKKAEEVDNVAEDRAPRTGRKRKEGPVDPQSVLRALSRALEVTELAYLDMTEKVLDTNPELALMGSCLLVVLMRDEDVYVMNVGDSRAIVAQYEQEEGGSSQEERMPGENGAGIEDIEEETSASEKKTVLTANAGGDAHTAKLTALQLSTDHSTSIEEEVTRIKNEHPDDSQCIVNGRVKGRLKVTRAFGAGSLKKPKLNNVLLEMFRNDYVGTAPYITCLPSLRHHRLCTRDQFLILSSDGLYQYLTNQEVVSHVENFMEKFPDGDPAQHLIEELLFRAAKKAGMDFHELLDIPQGDRRKYHDDVTVMVISLEGRIWKSSGKYP